MNTDMMYREKSYNVKPRVLFNPKNKSHMLDYAKFLKYNGWKDGCNYLLEEPYTDIPTMINAKIVATTLAPLVNRV